MCNSYDTDDDDLDIDIDVAYDTSKLTLKWYVDGVEDSSLENQTQVTFERPSDNSVKVYTWRVDDLTGTVKAPDDVTDVDFEEVKEEKEEKEEKKEDKK